MIRSLSRLSDREQTLAAAVVLLVLGYIFYIGICSPHVLRLNATRGKLDVKKELLDLKRKAAVDQSINGKQRSDLLEEIEKMDACYFAHDEGARLLSGLSDLVASTGCRLVQAAFVSEERLSPAEGGSGKERKTAGSWAGTGSGSGSRKKKAGGKESGRAWAENWEGPCLSQVSVRMTLIGRFGGLVALLNKVQSYGSKIHAGQLNIELVDHESADLNVSLVLTVFSIETLGGG